MLLNIFPQVTDQQLSGQSAWCLHQHSANKRVPWWKALCPLLLRPLLYISPLCRVIFGPMTGTPRSRPGEWSHCGPCVLSPTGLHLNPLILATEAQKTTHTHRHHTCPKTKNLAPILGCVCLGGGFGLLTIRLGPSLQGINLRTLGVLSLHNTLQGEKSGKKMTLGWIKWKAAMLIHSEHTNPHNKQSVNTV